MLAVCFKNLIKEVLFHICRSPVYVDDIVKIVVQILNSPPPSKVYNMGGPHRLSRLDMAVQVINFRLVFVSLALRQFLTFIKSPMHASPIAGS